MLAGRCRRPPRLPERPERPTEAGFSLVEFVVSIAVISVVMTALTMFFVTTVSVTSQQSGKQAAVRLADDGIERARALRGSAVTAGRDRTSTDNQWTNPVAGVGPHLVNAQVTWDSAAAFPAGASAPLPTSARPVTVNGVSYSQSWYVGKCWQPGGGGDCGATQTAGYIEFYRVIVAVNWPERHCAAATCSYVMSTLVSNAAAEPLFDTGQNGVAPTVTNPGNQAGDVTVVVSRQLTATGGTAPLTWAASGLPTGLSMNSSGLIAGTPTTPGTYPVTVTATDALSRAGTATFTWTINALPVLRNPGAQNSPIGTPVSLSIALTGGTGPFTWAITAPGPGLPAGLSINGSTGLISGTPTTGRPASQVTVRVTDAVGRTNSTTFMWRIG
jgi:prepilin-type N-terminal cleavage/methylation domain-containing protein